MSSGSSSQLCLQRSGNTTGSSVSLSATDSSTDATCGSANGLTNFFFNLLPGATTIGVLTTGGEAPSCLGFVDGGSSSGPMLQIAPLGPLGSSEAAYCGYDPSALTAGQSPSVVFQIELQDGLYSTIKSNFDLASATTSRCLAFPTPTSQAVLSYQGSANAQPPPGTVSSLCGTSPAGTGPLSNGTAAAVNRAATNPISDAISSNGGTSSGSSFNLVPAPAGAPTPPNVTAPPAVISVVPSSPTPGGSPAPQKTTTESLAADQQLYAASYAAGPYAALSGLSAPELAALQAAVEAEPEEAPAVASAPEVAAALATSSNPTATLGYELGRAIDARYGQGTAAGFQAHDRILGPFSAALQQNGGQCMANGTQLPAGSIGDFLNAAFCNLTGTVAAGAIGNTGVVSNLSQPQSMGVFDGVVVNTATARGIPLFDGTPEATATLQALDNPNATFSIANLTALNISANSLMGLTLGHLAPLLHLSDILLGNSSTGPTQANLTSRGAANCTVSDQYMLKAGDTCTTLAQLLGTTEQDLVNANVGNDFNCASQMTAGKFVCMPPGRCSNTYFTSVTDTCERLMFAFGIAPDVFSANNPTLQCNVTGLASRTFVCVDGGTGASQSLYDTATANKIILAALGALVDPSIIAAANDGSLYTAFDVSKPPSVQIAYNTLLATPQARATLLSASSVGTVANVLRQLAVDAPQQCRNPPRFQSAITTGCFCNADPVPHCTGLQNLDIFAVFSPNTGALATVQDPVTSPDDVESVEEALTDVGDALFGRRLSSVADSHPAILAARERVAQKQQSMARRPTRRLHQTSSEAINDILNSTITTVQSGESGNVLGTTSNGVGTAGTIAGTLSDANGLYTDYNDPPPGDACETSWSGWPARPTGTDSDADHKMASDYCVKFDCCWTEEVVDV
ncbi:hypothetical protein ABBQ38_002935 [Trebouxia sp. C0009 RCD-2024]